MNLVFFVSSDPVLPGLSSVEYSIFKDHAAGAPFQGRLLTTGGAGEFWLDDTMTRQTKWAEWAWMRGLQRCFATV